MTLIKCKYCKTLVEWKEGSKQRRYCNKPACRKRASRERKAEEKRRQQEQQQAALRVRWRHFHPRAVECLEILLTQYDLEAAHQATNAIEIQCRYIQGKL